MSQAECGTVPGPLQVVRATRILAFMNKMAVIHLRGEEAPLAEPYLLVSRPLLS
jgi:hypothetical protein